jgi:hypothetical protein
MSPISLMPTSQQSAVSVSSECTYIFVTTGNKIRNHVVDSIKLDCNKINNSVNF